MDLSFLDFLDRYKSNIHVHKDRVSLWSGKLGFDLYPKNKNVLKHNLSNELYFLPLIIGGNIRGTVNNNFHKNIKKLKKLMPVSIWTTYDNIGHERGSTLYFCFDMQKLPKEIYMIWKLRKE